MTRVSDLSRSAVLAEVIPAIRHGAVDHRRKCEAMFAELVRFIADTGDGSFAVIAGQALQFLPEAVAYHEDCIELDPVLNDFVTEEGLQLRVVDLVRHKKVLSLLESAGLHFTLREVV